MRARRAARSPVSSAYSSRAPCTPRRSRRCCRPWRGAASTPCGCRSPGTRSRPRPGRFEFATLDHWIALARIWHLHLVLLWFGSWKNAFSSYAPRWVLDDPRRYLRAVSTAGTTLPMLSVFGRATRAAVASAFAALMRHVRRIDGARRTVLRVQVENEVGYLGLGGRDRSPRADRLFDRPVPPRLLRALTAPGRRLPWRLAAHFTPAGRSWPSVFGPRADEMFMAWYYARDNESVAQAGKRQDPLPMYMNAQLRAAHERAGHHPSGGPYPLCQPVYRVAAPAVDFYAPDIYWPDFERWVTRYRRAGNPAFVPESRLELAPYDALYVFGEARGFGFSAFGVDHPLAPADQAERARAARRAIHRGAAGRAHARADSASAQPPPRADRGARRLAVPRHAGAQPAHQGTAGADWRGARARTPAQRV